MEKKFSDIMSDYFRATLKKFIPVFWIPVYGEKLLDRVMNSYAVSLLWKSWVMFSLM